MTSTNAVTTAQSCVAIKYDTTVCLLVHSSHIPPLSHASSCIKIDQESGTVLAPKHLMRLWQAMLSRTVRGVFIGLALVSTFTIRSSSTSTNHSSSADSNDYSDCNGSIDMIEDGYCDADNNNVV